MIGRIVEEHRTNYIVSFEGVEYTGVVRGAFHIDESEAFPKVGDFVECTEIAPEQVVIEAILPRRTEISRRAVESTSRQVMVANVDIIFVVMGLDDDFNVRRLERYLLLANQSNVEAIIILNKRDTVPNPDEYVAQVKNIAPDASVYSVSAKTGEGMDVFARHMMAETVAVLLGSSGAGKSTITNWLLDEERQATQSLRTGDGRGRHTTTGRQMFTIPSGGFLIDTPGMRELGVLGDEVDEVEVFRDFEALALTCKFTDCDHEKSEGCAILKAVTEGDVDENHFKNYLKLMREREFQQSKESEGSSIDRKQKLRKLDTGHKKTQKHKYNERDGV